MYFEWTPFFIGWVDTFKQCNIWGKIWGVLKKKNANNLLNRLLAFIVVVPPGFEPRLTEPKSDVLPLHHGTILMCFVKSSAKI